MVAVHEKKDTAAKKVQKAAWKSELRLLYSLVVAPGTELGDTKALSTRIVEVAVQTEAGSWDVQGKLQDMKETLYGVEKEDRLLIDEPESFREHYIAPAKAVEEALN